MTRCSPTGGTRIGTPGRGLGGRWSRSVNRNRSTASSQRSTTETDRARRWSLLDAALDLGHPGVVDGYGRFGRVCGSPGD